MTSSRASASSLGAAAVPPLPSARGATLRELVHARGEAQPDATAFIFLADGERDEEHLTYGGLDERARAIAELIRARRGRGDRVLLLFPPGLDFVAGFVGCLYANVVAVPAYPPQTRRAVERLSTIIDDAQAGLVLLSEGGIAPPVPAGADVVRLRSSELPAAPPWLDEPAATDQLALLQYTSGSTRAPRGVMVTHGNLVRNEEMIERAFVTDASSVVVSWLPFYHDMGLIGSLLHPLYLGAQCVLLSPSRFLQRPLRWLEAVTRFGATTSGGPNFGYDLCVERLDEARQGALDLSTWTVAYNGAEPIRSTTLERFAAAFAPYGFRPEAFHPCYGLAEATLMVTAGPPGGPPVVRDYDVVSIETEGLAVPAPVGGRRLVSSGTPYVRRLAIVSAEGKELPERTLGEIWVADECVAYGYRNVTAETSGVFRAYLADGEGPFLRTGDLGFVDGGELFVTGRVKDVIIVRGRNFAPQDIEQTVEESHPALRRGGGAAFSVEVAGEERLVVAQELERRATPNPAIAPRIRQRISEEHELSAHAVVLLKAGALPKTSSNKVQRHACRAGFMAGTLPALLVHVEEGEESAARRPALTRAQLLQAPAAERPALLEDELAALAARALCVPRAAVGADVPLTSFGLDSAAALALQHELQRDLGIDLPATTLLRGTSVRGLARLALERLTADARLPHVAAAPATGEHPLSHGQEGLWLLQQLASMSAVYTIGQAFRIHGRVDPDRLGAALETLVARHATLRTTYRLTSSGVVQRPQRDALTPLAVDDASAFAAEELAAQVAAELARPFDLEHGPVFRARLFRRGPGGDVLVLAVPHIASDFWGAAVLLEELGLLCADPEAELPPPAPAYVDYVRWQRDLLAGERGERLAAYWEAQLADAPTGLALPRRRLARDGGLPAGGTASATLGRERAERVRELAMASRVTPYTLLLAAYGALLHRYTGAEEVLVGTPAAGRPLPDLRRAVGYFVNALPIRIDLRGDPRFAELVERVQTRVLDALDHQLYPFPLMVERVHPDRDPSRPALFGAFFTLQKAEPWGGDALTAATVHRPSGRLALGPLEGEPLVVDQPLTQFALDLAIAEVEGELAALVRYSTDFLTARDADRLLARYGVLLDAILADPSRRVSDLPLTTPEERETTVGLSRPAGQYARDVRLYELFEESARRNPRRTALVHEGRSIPFADLEADAVRLATFVERLRPNG